MTSKMPTLKKERDVFDPIFSYEKHVEKKNVTTLNENCCNCIPIDIDPTGNVPFVISSPGLYVLPDDVDFSPLSANSRAIVVLSDDVTIDFCNHTVKQTSNSLGAICIVLGNLSNEIYNNITIRNGNITQFTRCGIIAVNLTMNTTVVSFKNIKFENLNILNCGGNLQDFYGIVLDSNADFNLYLDPSVAYENVTFTNCKVNNCNGQLGIIVYTAKNVILRDCTVNNLTYGRHSYAGAYDLTCINLQMYDCQGNNTTMSSAQNGNQVAGLYCTGSINCFFENCQFNNTYGEVSIIVNGANISNQQNTVYKNCQFNNITGGKGKAPAMIVNGIHMSDGPGQKTNGNGIKFINCQFSGHRISDDNNIDVDAFINQITGTLFVTVSNIVFENCQTVNISTNNPRYPCFGHSINCIPADPAFPYGSISNIIFKNCNISDIKANDNQAVGIIFQSTGFDRTSKQSSFSNLIVENCTVQNIQNLSSNYPAAGIGSLLNPVIDFLAKTSNVIVKNCIISDVRSNNDNKLSAGVLLESVSKPIVLENTISDCHRGVLLTGTNQPIPNGFQVALTKEDALSFPPIAIDLLFTSLGTEQKFINLTRSNSVTFSDVYYPLDLIYPNEDLALLKWKSGDEIIYRNNGGNDLKPLVNNQKYYLIVYIPGYCENGLIKQNNVSNCLISGYQDDKAPHTSSAWISNTAFCNNKNYKINWEKKAPVSRGTLECYPKPKYYTYNTSISCKKC